MQGWLSLTVTQYEVAQVPHLEATGRLGHALLAVALPGTSEFATFMADGFFLCCQKYSEIN